MHTGTEYRYSDISPAAGQAARCGILFSFHVDLRIDLAEMIFHDKNARERPSYAPKSRCAGRLRCRDWLLNDVLNVICDHRYQTNEHVYATVDIL